MSEYKQIGDQLAAKIVQIRKDIQNVTWWIEARGREDYLSIREEMEEELENTEYELVMHMDMAFGDVESTCDACGQDNTFGDCLCTKI